MLQAAWHGADRPSPAVTAPAPAASRTPVWRAALRPLGVMLGAAIVAALVWKIGLHQVAAVVARANLPLLAVVVGLNVPVVALRAWRTEGLLARLDAHVPFLEVVGTQLVGQTLSWLTPAASGDLSRAYLWKRRSGVPTPTGALVVVAERLLSLLLLIEVGLAAASTMFGLWQLWLVAVAAIGLAALPWLLARAGLLAGMLRGLAAMPLLRRRAEAVDRLSRDLVALSGDGRLMVRFSLLTAAVFALSAAQVWLLTIALGASLGWLAAVAGTCLSQAAGSLTALPFGLGPGDALLVALTAWGGVAGPAAAAVAILVRLTTTLPIALGAAAVWAREG